MKKQVTVMSCIGCSAREEMLIHLRQQNRELQDKLLSLVPDAMDRYHRLRMTEVASMRPEIADSVVPMSQFNNQDPEQEMINSMFESVTRRQ